MNIHLLQLQDKNLLPLPHIKFLNLISGIRPNVIYDIGSSTLHWAKQAKLVWPKATYVLFEAMPEVEFLYKQSQLLYSIGVLSDVDNNIVDFYQNLEFPAGNSYYKENEKINSESSKYFNESHIRKYKTKTLDTVVKENKFPYPDLIKMDVQGAEYDVLRGASQCLKHCKHLILELQNIEYNCGAPLKDTVIEYVKSLGFYTSGQPFCDNGPDGDYYFCR